MQQDSPMRIFVHVRVHTAPLLCFQRKLGCVEAQGWVIPYWAGILGTDWIRRLEPDTLARPQSQFLGGAPLTPCGLGVAPAPCGLGMGSEM